MIFGIKEIYNFEPYNVLLAIATNIPVLLMTDFVLQGHKCVYVLKVMFLKDNSTSRIHFYNLLTPMSSKMFMSFFSSIAKKLSSRNTFQDFFWGKKFYMEKKSWNVFLNVLCDWRETWTSWMTCHFLTTNLFFNDSFVNSSPIHLYSAL